MRSLSDFVAMLPGVMPRKARASVLAGEILSPTVKADLHERDSFFGQVIEVGPDAAAAILTAYRTGLLPMKLGAMPTAAPHAEAYVAERAQLVAEREERDRRKRSLKDLSLITEVDLRDHDFLDQVFHAHLGQGDGTLTLAGVTITKTLTRYSSNSGKSRGWGVSFSWIGSDGQRHTSSKLPPEVGNRRNDAERNWGLPE